MLGNSLKKLNQPNLITIFVGIALGVLLGSIPLLNVPQPVKLGLAGGPLIVAILIGRFGPHYHLVTYTTMSANLMLREVGIAPSSSPPWVSEPVTDSSRPSSTAVTAGSATVRSSPCCRCCWSDSSPGSFSS